MIVIKITENKNDTKLLTTSNQPLEHAVVQEGKHIANNIILALIGELPLYQIANGSIAGILFKLFNLCPGMLLEWVQEPLLKPK